MKLQLVLAVVVAVFLFCSAVYGAEGEEMFGDLFAYSGKIAVAGNVSGAMPKDGDATLFLGGYLSYDVLNCLGLGIESGWARWSEETGGVDYGKLTMIPLIGDIFLKAPIKIDQYKIVPYGVVGLGVLFWDFEESSVVKNAGATVSIDPSFAMKFGAGVDFFFTENIAVFGEGSFIWADADVTVAGRGAVASATVDTDLWLLGGGIKYVF